MSGSGVYVTHPWCPDCYGMVECRVLVTSSGRTHILSGIEEHKRVCRAQNDGLQR